MDEITKNETKALAGLRHAGNGEIEIPRPFEREVFLFDTFIAGTTHIDDIHEIEPELAEGDRLGFLREPDNRYDEQAIMISDPKGRKLGYVPRKDNVVFSRLMDAGKLLYGRVTGKKKKGSWLRIDIRVYLHE